MHDQLTQVDMDKMRAELKERTLELRPKLLAEVKRTREFGDLSENAEYKCAKQAQNQNERRIRYLEGMIRTAVVVTNFAKGGEVGLLSKVTLYFEDDDEEEQIQLVTTLRIDVDRGYVSIASPLGKALMGHKVGDRVEVHVNDIVSYYVVIRAVEQGEDNADLPIRQF